MPSSGDDLDAYHQEGLSGLAMSRPRRLTEAQAQQLDDMIVEKTPADAGFPSEMNRRAPLLQE